MVISGLVVVFGYTAVTIGYNLRVNEEKPAVSSRETVEVEKKVLTVGTLWDETNKRRMAAGVRPLNLNTLLNNSATEKCEDMQAKHYWEHVAPDGTEPWGFIQKNINYTHAGENLAKDYFTSKDVVNGWMQSASHKKTMLDSKYTEVGFAICDSMVVQHLVAIN